MNDINLLVKGKEARFGSRLILRILRITSVVCLVLLSIFSITFFFLRVQSPLQQLKNEESSLLSQIEAIKEKSLKLFILHERISALQNVLTKRKDYTLLIDKLEKVEKISKKVPSDATIQAFSLDPTQVSITVSSSSPSSLDTFLNYLIELALRKEVFEKLTLNGIALDDKNGEYTMSIEGKLL